MQNLKYRGPNEPITKSIERLLTIANKRAFLVVAVFIQRNKVKALCNKMKTQHQRNKVYCRILENIISIDYCMTKCPAAPIAKELLERSKDLEPKNAIETPVTLENFLPPKN
ncbi:MAG: hypothetical protein AOA65_2174 [Candidatus Bathyarchaeota archaeon BA1]|nr:MAG: hypothetical protein AOA65_2174 [Candidatus Bathyarchaeota archaeon BA1]